MAAWSLSPFRELDENSVAFSLLGASASGFRCCFAKMKKAKAPASTGWQLQGIRSQEH